MKFRIAIVVFLLANVLFGLFYLFWLRAYVPFMPLQSIEGSSEYREVPRTELPADFPERLIRVLEEEKREFREEDGEVLIRRGLFMDARLISELTAAASDSLPGNVEKN